MQQILDAVRSSVKTRGGYTAITRAALIRLRTMCAKAHVKVVYAASKYDFSAVAHAATNWQQTVNGTAAQHYCDQRSLKSLLCSQVLLTAATATATAATATAGQRCSKALWRCSSSSSSSTSSKTVTTTTATATAELPGSSRRAQRRQHREGSACCCPLSRIIIHSGCKQIDLLQQLAAVTRQRSRRVTQSGASRRGSHCRCDGLVGVPVLLALAAAAAAAAEQLVPVQSALAEGHADVRQRQLCAGQQRPS
eukprot:6427-Heterococcus_DN1.PRE.10